MNSFFADLFFNIQNTYIKSNQFDHIIVSGPDAKNFLQGQVTQNVFKISKSEGLISCRLNRTGLIQSSFYLWGENEVFNILIPKKLSYDLTEDLKKYIIMEDVTLELIRSPLIYFIFSHEQISNSVSIPLYGMNVRLLFNFEMSDSFKELENLKIKHLEFVSTWPENFGEGDKNLLVNNSVFNDIGVDYSKGCFLGQETASKINNNRGASKKVVIFKINDFMNFDSNSSVLLGNKQIKFEGFLNIENITYISIRVGREFMVIGKDYRINIDGKEFFARCNDPFSYANLNLDSVSEVLYDRALELYHREDYILATSYLELLLEYNPFYYDAYEIIGVIYGRLEKYQQAIDWMDRLLEKVPNSVMGHTNKSLYYMKIGEIEKAEEEKALATIASFEENGEIAKKKKEAIEKVNRDKEELQKRKTMFEQVLDIDPDDQLANYGLADIAFTNNEFGQAKNYLEKVLEVDENYSVAYLKLGETLIALNESSHAKKIFKKGIEVAVKKGDMMPANKMQSLLHKL
ncbi:MAG: hypothetical protein H6622_03750 [Halobacteriovoraceae bacterium]|nr:hypothetical protein [Halobacteriovoraceae bacterium]